MEIHPRTVAASYRDQARELDREAEMCEMGSHQRSHASGMADGLRLAAEDMEQRADAEFDRIMAEHQARGQRASVTAIEAAAAVRRAGVGRSS